MAKRLTTTQVALELRVSRGRIVAMIASGRLKATRFGRDWSVWDTDIDAVRTRKAGRPRKGIE